MVRYTGLDGKLRKTIAVFPSCSSVFLEEELTGRLVCGWLLSDVVGGHYTNAKKQTQTVDLFRLIIVIVSLCVATRYRDSNYIFIYILEHSLSYRLV